MFFSAYLGPEQQLAPWRAAVEQHAHWSGLRATPARWRLPNGMLFTCVWLTAPHLAPHPHVQEVGDLIELGTSCDVPGSLPWQAESDPADSNEVRLRLAQSQGALAVIHQPLSPEHLFYTMTVHGIALSNDLRLLIRLRGLELDERAVYSLLQYGAILPPFSISRQIQRLPNGHTLRVTSESGALTTSISPSVRPTGNPLPQGLRPAAAVRQTMDGILSRVPYNSALLFSGGVDSGLMAARLAALNRYDVHLVNFSFGPDDQESALARRMAAHLGMRCEQIAYDQSGFMDVLWRATEDYSFPFGDFSVIPMNMMIRAAFGSAAQTPSVIEGAGADDSFSIGLVYPGWRRLYRIPRVARATAGRVYAARGMWRRDSRQARVGRVLRRSAQMPLLLAGAHAQNSLDGIAYHMPRTVREQVDGSFTTYRAGLVSHLPPADQFSLAMVTNDSVGRVAAKSFDPLRARGMLPCYPFLEPAILRLGLSLTWQQKSAGGEPKAILKGLLAEQVPREMVYRRKSGFIPPYEAMLAPPPMQAYLREIALDSSSPLAPYIERRVVEQMARQSQGWDGLNLEAYFFLWALTFLTAWLYPLHQW